MHAILQPTASATCGILPVLSIMSCDRTRSWSCSTRRATRASSTPSADSWWVTCFGSSLILPLTGMCPMLDMECGARPQLHSWPHPRPPLRSWPHPRPPPQEAATRYYELSQVGKRKIGDHEVRGSCDTIWRQIRAVVWRRHLQMPTKALEQPTQPLASKLFNLRFPFADPRRRPGAGAAPMHLSKGKPGVHLSSKHSCLFCIHRRFRRKTWSRRCRPPHPTARIQLHKIKKKALVSVVHPPQISEEDLEQALQSSIKCAVLAAAGPQRSRMLATLYKASPGLPFVLLSAAVIVQLRMRLTMLQGKPSGGCVPAVGEPGRAVCPDAWLRPCTCAMRNARAWR